MGMVISQHACAAIHAKGLPGDEVAQRGGEEEHGAHQILRHLNALEGSVSYPCLPEAEDLLAGVFFREGSSRRYGVHLDVVISVLAGERAGEADNSGLGGHVVDSSRAAA